MIVHFTVSHEGQQEISGIELTLEDTNVSLLQWLVHLMDTVAHIVQYLDKICSQLVSPIMDTYCYSL